MKIIPPVVGVQIGLGHPYYILASDIHHVEKLLEELEKKVRPDGHPKQG